MKKTILSLSLLTLIASGCSTTSVQKADESTKQGATTVAPEALSSIELVKVNRAIARLNAEIDELDQLETSVYANSLNPDKKAQAALERKIQDYGTIETLQANIRVLIAMKQAIAPTPVQKLETASNKTK